MTQFFMRWPGGLQKAVSLSYDDGTATDKPVLEIMRAYGVKGTFHLSSGYHGDNGLVDPPTGLKDVRLPLAECAKYYDPALCEVTGHSLTHAMLTQLPAPMIAQQFMQDRKILEQAFGRIVNGFSYPFGVTNPQVIEIAKSCGIAYARTGKSTKKFLLPEDWLLWHPTTHHNDPELPQLTQSFLAPSRYRYPQLFLLWGHSAEFLRDNNWNVLEDFCKTVGGRDDVWYATCGEIYRYAKAYGQLQFNANRTVAYNPTATDLWVSLGPAQQPVCIPSGQRISL